MSEINQAVEDVKSVPAPKLPERTPEEQINFERWDNISHDDIVKRLRLMDFIVDGMGILDQYTDMRLPEGWALATTSKSNTTLGTITLVGHNDFNTRILRRAMKSFIANHGLRLSQADTVMETLYYAKFKLLPLLSVVLADKDLYEAYRRYKRSYNSTDYINWIHTHKLQENSFNIHLSTVDRVQISEMLERMVKADVKLRGMRAAGRARHNAK